MEAIHRAGGFSDDNAGDFKKCGWARTARTDKGVHAAANIVCFKMLMKENIMQSINQELPPAIRAVKYLRVGKTFNAKSAASSRTYLYFIPSFAFATPAELSTLEAPIEAAEVAPEGVTEMAEIAAESVPEGAVEGAVEEEVVKEVAAEGDAGDVGDEGGADGTEREDPAVTFARRSKEQKRLKGFRLPQEGKDRLSRLLKGYVGTKNFHNFTSRKDPLDKSNMRCTL
jgi:tRNA pseudouridine38-40 synthase